MTDRSPSRRTVLAGAGAALALPGRLAAAPAAIVNRILVDEDRLLVGAALGGETMLFVIDTGAPMSFLRPEIAKRLRLPAVAGQSFHGLGARGVAGAVVTARDFAFGNGIRLAQVAFTTFDFGRILPADAAGSLAAGLFTGYDSEFDFAAGHWTIWRDGRRDRAGLTRMASRFTPASTGNYAPKILIDATLDGQAYRLTLDTGAPGGVTLFPRAARRSGLFDDARPFAPVPTGGFGGLAARPSRVVRTERFVAAPLAVERPLVTVMDPDQRSLSESDGLLGLGFMRALTIDTDVHGRCLWAAPGTLPAAVLPYRLSGLWLDRGRDGPVVAVVGTGSPAAAAGMRVGDVLTTPATFGDALAAIAGPPGRTVEVVVRGAPRRWTLAPWL